jgi:hypothetical protein|eukprot:COSAG02_NODE_2847_length_7905_cov_3.444017_2_plen_302_part_00
MGGRSNSPSPAAQPRRRTVAIVGSTGGGAANAQALGAANAHANLTLLIAQLEHASIEVTAVVFTSCDSPMDTAMDDSQAALWRLTSPDVAGARRLVKTAEGRLQDVNDAARAADVALTRGKMPDGVVMISGDVDDVHRHTMVAAAKLGLPVVCTGGTGTGKALELSCNVVQGGGSVATTRESRAIAFTSALAAHWRLSYSPKLSDSGIDLHSLLDGCLPAFLAMVVLRTVFKILPPKLAELLPLLPPANAVLAVVGKLLAPLCRALPVSSVRFPLMGSGRAACLYSSCSMCCRRTSNFALG